MNKRPKIAVVVISGIFLFGCKGSGSKNNEPLPPRISKAIPLVYIAKNDKRIHQGGDTVYLEGKFFSGFLFELNSEGDTMFVGSYFNGVEEGLHAKFYPNGTKQEERFYINGGKDGLQRGWWPDGKLKFLFTCYDNEFEGKFEEWSDSGMLIKQFDYKRGYEDGPQKLWWSNGVLRANYVVKNGRKYGLIGLELCSNPYDSVTKK
jgi:hypothetical protein